MNSKELNVQLVEYRSVLKNLAYKFTNDPEDIQDLVQETLLRAMKYIDQFFNNPKIISWLFVIMKNIYINHYRNKKHKYTYETHQATQYLERGCHEPFTESSVERRLVLKEIYKVLESMPKENKDIFELHLKGYKYRELSDMFNIPEGTVKSKIFLIKRRLQQQFA